MTDDPTITISEGGFEIPVVEVLTGRGVIFGKSGSGKSNSLGVIAEELLSQGFPLCIVDADGEHYGLKEEYELLHVGGDDSADVRVGVEHAEALADIMLHEDVPVILDTSGYIEEQDAHELVERVVSRLFSMEKKAKKPFPVFVEEVHELVPEGNRLPSVGKSLVKVAKRGRKHGLGIVGASQRPAEVKKSFVTQASWSVWHKLTWSQDTDVVRDIIDKEHAEAVQDLDTGQAIIHSDWMDAVRTVQFREKHTFDAGATPGLDEFTTPELKGVSDTVVETLESITEEKEREEETAERLEAEVESLREEKHALEVELDELRSGDAVESEEVERLQERIETVRNERDELATRVDELTEWKDDAVDSLEERQERIEELEAELESVADATSHLRSALGALGADTAEYEDHEMEQRINRLEESLAEVESERDSLRRKLESAETESILAEDAEYMDFIEREAVQQAIQTAKDENTPKYVRGVVGAIVEEGGPVSYEDVAERLGLAQTNHVSSAATMLETLGVVEKVEVDGGSGVDLHVDGIETIIARQQKRERTEEVMEKI